MGNQSSQYDVLIVGGRPAGASLAARLAGHGLKVLVVDRSTFPSLPGVPSSPILYPAGMSLLDELGIEESAYSDASSKMTGFAFDFCPHWSADIRCPPMTGREYIVGTNRVLLDDALWKNLARFPTVERRESFSVSDVLRDTRGRVIGILGASEGGAEERIEAGCVVGADGRFSLIARKAGSAVVEDKAEHVSTVYYADWENVAPARDGSENVGQVCTTGRGLDVLSFSAPGNVTNVNTHARADRVQVDGDPQRYYEATLKSIPRVARRLAGAKQVSRVVGIKRVGNAYRAASGPGWVLVGDAFHYKDPVDGQGIYDALVETKLLAAELVRWHHGADWTRSMASYEAAARSATHPMFLATTGRLKRELYEEPPVPVIKTMIRWMMTDPKYQETFVRVLNREGNPAVLTSPKLMAGAIARGIRRDAEAVIRARSFDPVLRAQP